MKKVNINYGKVQPVNKIWLSREEAMCFLGCADDYLRISRKTKCSAFTKHFVPKSHLLTQFKM